MNKVKVAVLQIRTELKWEETMEKVHAMLREAKENQADIAVLPEMFSCPYDGRYFKSFAAMGHEKTVELLSAWAREFSLLLVGGSVPEAEDGKLYNTCFVFNAQGEQIARHRKVHLFDVDLPDMHFKESHNFSPGNEITCFETPFGTMGCAVCFDLRFPELFRAMAVRGARVIFLPAQFNMTTGPRHWDMSLRMRAVDNELFMVGASAARYEGFSYECWGHSTVADPFGTVIASCDEKEQILYAELDLDDVQRVRAELPTFLKLRRDVYRVAE